jgi:predicted NBD/HSP70 family sugar kinase
MRQFNERVVLHAIRLHGALPKAELSRLTRLGPQTASAIVDGLLEDGLVQRQARLRGRVGQPSVPIALAPDGAFTIGVKLGRRSLDVLAVDFVGQVRARERLDYPYPDPRKVFPAIRKRLGAVERALGPQARRLVGVGVAAPLWLWAWGDFLGAPPGIMESWNRIDIHARIQAMTALPVEFAKDTTAACAAELVMGRGRDLRSFLYLFIGTFIGGGLVLDGRLHTGPRGNAAAVGSLPLAPPLPALRQAQGEGSPPASGDSGREQLLHRASGLGLEQLLQRHGHPATSAHDERAVSPPLWPLTSAWLEETGPALAHTVASAAALLDLDAVVIDGSMDRRVVTEAVARTERALDRTSLEGVHRPRLVVGTVGSDARALGGAVLPLHRHFAPLHELFLKAEP